MFLIINIIVRDWWRKMVSKEVNIYKITVIGTKRTHDVFYGALKSMAESFNQGFIIDKKGGELIRIEADGRLKIEYAKIN